MPLKHFLFLFFFINYLIGAAQELNKKDNNGKKQGHWVFYGKDRPGLDFKPNVKYEEGTFKNGRKEGEWIVYHKDGKTPKIKAIYRNNRPYGAYAKFYSNGKTKEKGSIINNLNLDSIVKFHPNGKIKYVALVNVEGNEDGDIKYYYPNGNLEFEYSSINGSPSGSATLYFKDGTVKKRMEYTSANEMTVIEEVNSKKIDEANNSKVENKSENEKLQAPKIGTPITIGAKFDPNGRNKCYNKNKELWQDGLFKNGRLWEGRVFIYDNEGILIKIKKYKEGSYAGTVQL